MGSQRLRWRFGHACVGLQVFVKHLYLPPFFVGHGDGVIVAREVTANQVQCTGAAVLVFKDLADPLSNPCTALCSGNSNSSTRTKRFFLPVLLAQRRRPVVLERRDEVLSPARDEIKILLRGEPTVHQHEVKLQGVLQAGMNRLAHHFIFGLLAFAFNMARRHVATSPRRMGVAFAPTQTPPELTCRCSGTAR